MQNYIYGAGGHGKVVLDAMQTTHIVCAGFIDDKDISSWMGLCVNSISDVTIKETCFHLAIGNFKDKETIAKRLGDVTFFNAIHSTAIISKSALIGTGTLLAANSILAPDVQIGNHCIVNHSVVIDHDCIVGDYSHIAPQSSLGGGVEVGRGVLVGAGAIVLPGIEIADEAIIGAGAVVTKNVAAGITVVGNPARHINQ